MFGKMLRMGTGSSWVEGTGPGLKKWVLYQGAGDRLSWRQGMGRTMRSLCEAGLEGVEGGVLPGAWQGVLPHEGDLPLGPEGGGRRTPISHAGDI